LITASNTSNSSYEVQSVVKSTEEEFTYTVSRIVAPAYYHMGIGLYNKYCDCSTNSFDTVDILQDYSLKKKLETFVKV
jgi:hypothetical protein